MVFNIVPALTFYGVTFCIYLIISLSLNIEFGYAGIPNVGKVLFVGIGGLLGGTLSYRLALYILNLHASDIIANQFQFSGDINAYLSGHGLFAFGIFLFSLVIGAGAGALVGFLASYPAIRLREDYLGMLLLAAGQFMQVFVSSYYPITGGTEGLIVPDPLAFTVTNQGLRQTVLLGVLAIFAAGIFLYAERVARSPLGRMLRAVRDNEDSSDALGKDNVAIRRNVLIIASAISGIAGVLYVLYQPYISPSTFLRTEFTFFPFVIVILGGMANNIGVTVGTLVFVAIIEILDQAKSALNVALNIPTKFFDLNAMEPILIGALLIIIIMVRPQGIIPEKSTLTISKSKLRNIIETLKKSPMSS
ncbi:MAG: branched-chain amino acid ABC transporter permease [Thaumarchaeota archaeon]|nr:branched-chain amino acid ABC transporter permease [Nitrososphaerota archaeon]